MSGTRSSRRQDADAFPTGTERTPLPGSFLTGLVMMGLLVLAAVLAPVICSCDPLGQDLFNVLKPPGTRGHLLGTDQLGRDIFARLLYAARTDLAVMVLAEVAPFLTGIFLGMTSAYFGKKVEWVISLITDTFIAFPYYLLVIVVVFLTGAGAQGIFITFMLVGWLVYARVAKGSTASLRSLEWVESAKIMGYSDVKIILSQIFPNVLPQAVVVLMTDMAGLLVIIVTLGYLGIGIAPPTPDWGTMISEGQNFMTTAWWLSTLPGLMVVYTGIALSFLGDGLADLWNAGTVGGSTKPAGRKKRKDSGAQENALQESRMRNVLPEADGEEEKKGTDRTAIRENHTGADIPCILEGIELENTRQRLLVKGISLILNPGETLGVVGESGSGKTLLLKCIAGLLPEGITLRAGKVTVTENTAMIFQDPNASLDPLCPVFRQLREVIMLRQRVTRQEAQRIGRELVRRLSLPEDLSERDRLPSELSGGQRQRILIAIALAVRPSLLLCDEPTTALDVTAQKQTLELIRSLQKELGFAMIFVTHNMAVASGLCERLVVMQEGRILEQGSRDRILKTPREEYTKELLDAVLEIPELAADPAETTRGT